MAPSRFGKFRFGLSPFAGGARGPAEEIGPTNFTVGQTFHDPTLTILVSVRPTHFTVGQTFHNPALANVYTIFGTPFSVKPSFHPPALAARFSHGIAPNPFSVAPRFQVPGISGGDTTLRVFLSGQDISKYVSLQPGDNTIVYQSSARATLSLVCKDPDGTWSGPVQPSDATKGLGQPIIVNEGGSRMFMGCLIDVKMKRPDCLSLLQYTLTATDKAGRCDWRRVFDTYKAGTDVADAIRAIVAKNLNNEGITTGGVPATLGPIDVDEVFNWDTVTTAFDRLSADAVASWWVDQYGVLYVVPIDSLPSAPFGLQEVPPGGPGTQNDWSNMTVQTNLSDYRNHQIVLSNLAISSAQVPTITETYTLPQPEATARGYRLGTIVLDFYAQSIESLKVNGTPQPVQNGTDLGTNFDKSWWYPVLPYPFIYAPNADLPTPTPPLGFPYYATTSPFPNAGDVVEITYVPVVNNSQTVTADALAPTIPGLARCGSGIYENVEQVSNITTPADMSAIAQALLSRASEVPYFLTYDTWRPGLRVGQKQHVDLPLSKIPSTDLVITAMSGSHQGRPVGPNGKVGDLGKGSAWKWTVSANSVSATAQVKLLEKIINRSTHPLPLVAYESEQIILAPGSSVASGVNATNPTIARQSGVLVEVVVQCGVAPTDQTLVLDIINSRYGSILGPNNLIKIPSGDLSQHIVTKFVGDPASTYMFRNDGLTVSASYIVTGSSPARAGSVTIIVRWQVPSLPAGF